VAHAPKPPENNENTEDTIRWELFHYESGGIIALKMNQTVFAQELV
jgi:hypothetical protein